MSKIRLYVFSTFDWFEIDASTEQEAIAACAMLGDHLGIMDETERLIKPPHAGESWYTKTLRKSKAKIIDEENNLSECLLSLRTSSQSIIATQIVQDAHDIAKRI